MSDAEIGMPDLVTFDCYGTLIDWRGGIRRAFHDHVPPSRSLDPDDLFAAFAEVENEIEAGDYRPYRRVLRETAEEIARRFGWELPPDGGRFLADSLPSWKPFPETNRVLERLEAGGRALGILSNVDDDLLRATLRHLGVSFDLLVTAEATGAYKPAPDHFHRALEAVDRDPGRLFHVAQSHHHDVQASVPLGIPTVWVNRHGEAVPEAGPRPTVEVGDLEEALEWLERR